MNSNNVSTNQKNLEKTERMTSAGVYFFWYQKAQEKKLKDAPDDELHSREIRGMLQSKTNQL